MPYIVRVDTIVHKVILKSAFKISHTVMEQTQERLFVRVHSDDGCFGIGEAAPLTFFTGETTPVIKEIIDHVLGPAIIGQEALDVRAAIARLEEKIPGNSTAKTAVEMAIWDLAGKCQQIPVYRLLGGKLREAVPIAYVLGLSQPQQMAEEAKKVVAKGYNTIKTKLTGDINTDLSILEAIREAVGDNVALRVDANSAYSVKDAILAARQFEPFDLQYIEQPCAPSLPGALSQVREHTAIPIAADESLLSKADAFNLISTGSVDWLVIKLIKVGGIMSALEIATFASWAGIGCTVVSPIETSIGTAAGLHLAAVMPSLPIAHELCGPEYLVDDPVCGLGPIKPVLSIDDSPGLGVEVPEDFFNED
ncbi:MAG: mandelate racemase/muconate lactonizing enzyme family protein [bacterium]|jgi:o-succinylbenzoate synthase